MDFFQAQDHARRQTRVLVGLFALAVVAIVLAVYAVVAVVGGVSLGMGVGFDPGLFLGVAAGTSLLIGLGSLFRTAQLRKGGPAVAELLGAQRVSPDTSDPAERRLFNVVEEMAVASGSPVPAVYVMEGEGSINAFAAGHGIHDAAIAVTRGTLETLDRDELQGVIAHEFSHILNGDMRLNLRLVGLLFGILLLAIVGRGLLRSQAFGRRRRGGDARGAVLGLALLALGYIGVFFGKLIKAAVSRQREFLADASAVQFTRNPDGIGGALRKIGAHAAGSRIENHHAEELSHLFFANGLGSALSRVTATHPPLEERIRRIDPAWDGSFEVERALDAGGREGDAADAGGDVAAGADAEPRFGGIPGGVIGAAAVLAAVGNPSSAHVEHARRMLDGLPDALRDAAHDPEGAQALLLAILGADDLESGEPAESPPEVAARLAELRPLVGTLPPEARLPLLDLALPALGELSPDRAAAFRSEVERRVGADGEIRPFEFALMHVLWKHLSDGRGRSSRRSRRTTRSLGALRHELEVVLSALARAGADGPDSAADAFSKGAKQVADAVTLASSPPAGMGMAEVDEALSRLEEGSLEARRRVLEACAVAALSDERVRAEEAELLRAVAESLELPLPPFLSAANVGPP